MVRNLYSVFDKVAAAYLEVWPGVNDSTAVRALQAGLRRQKESEMVSSPGDYCLYRVGSFDDAVGLLAAVSPPVIVAEVAALVGGE